MSNRVIRQLQDTLAKIETGEIRNLSETILTLVSQLEERDTTLSQLRVCVCCLMYCVIPVGFVIHCAI